MAKPLTPAAFQILLALADGPLHGLGIADSIDELSEGDFRLGPGTLYRTLAGLTRRRLIRPIGADGDDSRRKRYEITNLGRRRLREEGQRLERLVTAALERSVATRKA